MIFDWSTFADFAGKIALAYLLTLPLGWEREHEERGVGLRTFPLVAIASCGYALLGRVLGGSSPDAESRIIQGLVTGIGFIGAGAILKGAGNVHGTATAASIWNTGVIGASVGVGRFEIAILLSILNLVTLRLLLPLKSRLNHEPEDGKNANGGTTGA